MVKIGKAKLKYVGLTILLVIFIASIIFIANSTITGLVIKDNALEKNCKEFKENVLWSSGYNNKPQGSINYQVWHLEHNCTEIDVSNCFLGDVEIKTRFLHFGSDNETGEGYIQISEPDESICDAPEKGNYLQYLSSEKLKGENESFEIYCGKDKKSKEKCEIETSIYRDYAKCYGIKVYGSQYMLVDALEIKYYLCWEKEGEK